MPCVAIVNLSRDALPPHFGGVFLYTCMITQAHAVYCKVAMFVRIPKLYQYVAIYVCLSFAIGSILLQPKSAQAAPFTCSSSLYQEISGQLRVLDPLSNTFVDVGPDNGFNINAMGYNTVDNYIYGMDYTNSHLLRIESDGTYTDLGVPTGLAGINYFSGDMDQAGNLYIKGNSDMYVINVSTNTATILPLSDSFITFDLVYINGFLYGIGTGGLGTSLFKVDVSNGTVTSLLLSIPMFSGYGSGWATDVNSLYFSHNNTGIIYKITNYDTAPIATPVLNSSPTVENDGASCFSAPSPIPGLVANNKVNASQMVELLGQLVLLAKGRERENPACPLS